TVTPPTPEAVTPAPTAPPKSMRELLARITRKQLTIGASAVFSLIAGIGLVRLIFPAKDEAKPTTPQGRWSPDQFVSANRGTPAPAPAPAAPKGPSVEVVPPGGTLPPVVIPEAPAAPSAARPTYVSPVPPVPPVVVPEAPRYPSTPVAPAYPAA